MSCKHARQRPVTIVRGYRPKLFCAVPGCEASTTFDEYYSQNSKALMRRTLIGHQWFWVPVTEA